MSISRFDIRNQLNKDIKLQTGKPALVPAPPIGPPGSGPALGGAGAQTMSPAPPAQRTSGASSPASAGSSNGGAGTSKQMTPVDMLTGAEPESVIKAAEVASRATGKSGATDDVEADAKKQKINESMAAQGMDPVEAYTELKDQYLTSLEQKHQAGQIDKKHYTKLTQRWKNIFNVVPKEDMGLFLMDFGLRLAAASAENSFGGAFGQAGLGALQGVQQRQQQEEAGALNRDQMAHERAMDMVGMRQTQQRLDTVNKGAPLETTTGIMQQGPDGKWGYITDPETGQPVMPSYAGAGGYRGEKAWLFSQLKSAHEDWDDAKIMDTIINSGGMSLQERDAMWRKEFARLAESIINRDESGKSYSKYSDAEREEWVRRALHLQDQTMQQYQQENAERRALDQYR